MSNDPINRLPPPPPPDPLRTASIDAVQPTKREPKDEGKPNDDAPDADTKHADPEDEIVISADVPNALQDGLDHPDNPDAFQISLIAVQDLLEQHRADYSIADMTHLNSQLAFLQTHAIVSLFWPPSMTLREAIDQACNAMAGDMPLLMDESAPNI